MVSEDIQIENNNSNEIVSVLLIDIENCPNQIHQLQESLEKYYQVIICYAQSGAKVPLDWLMPLSTMINRGKLKILKMPNSGKNATDFGISFYAGILTQQLQQRVKFVIVSNDKDLDHVINLLKSQGRSAERIGTKKEEKQVTDKASVMLSLTKTYCEHLITHSKTRPVKQRTLLKSIKNKFKDDSKAEEIMQSLTTQGAIKIVEEKVSYDDKEIKKLAHGE